MSANCPRANYLGGNYLGSNFFFGGAQLSRGQLSGGTLIREGAIILRDSCPEGNYPRGQLPVRQSSFPKNMFLFLKEINKTRVIKYDPLPTIS